MSRLFFAFSCLFFVQILNAQICGTPQEPLLARITEHQKAPIAIKRGAIKYVPITFHLVANAAGEGRVTEEAVLRQLCALNNQYADQEMVFYIDRLNYFDNEAVYETPAVTAARIQMRLKEDNNSINIFITNKADSGNGGPGETLAYYDPQDDWIVSRKNQISGTSKTLAHELGHFFSLPHPHAGWDCYPYTEEDYGNPVSADFTIGCDGGGGSILIELQDGSNCATAGDKICDTPADYNLGLVFDPGCEENTVVRDKNNQLITPLVMNYMAYYSGCDTNSFTTTQKTMINTDFFSAQRFYIRTGKIPNQDSVEAPVTYISPINGEFTSGFLDVLLDWENTPGATHYLVIIDRNQSFSISPKRYIVTTSQVVVDELPSNIIHYWKVYPYNESQTCANFSPTQNFRTGLGTGINEIAEINEFSLAPNPISGNELSMLNLTTVSSFEADLKITDVSGHVFSQQHLMVPAGFSQHSLETNELTPGIYFVLLQSKSGTLVERLMVMD